MLVEPVSVSLLRRTPRLAAPDALACDLGAAGLCSQEASGDEGIAVVQAHSYHLPGKGVAAINPASMTPPDSASLMTSLPSSTRPSMASQVRPRALFVHDLKDALKAFNLSFDRNLTADAVKVGVNYFVGTIAPGNLSGNEQPHYLAQIRNIAEEAHIVGAPTLAPEGRT